jgi:hypothetical protein
MRTIRSNRCIVKDEQQRFAAGRSDDGSGMAMKQVFGLVTGTLAVLALFAGCGGDDNSSPPSAGGGGKSGDAGSASQGGLGGRAGAGAGGATAGGSNHGGASSGGAAGSGTAGGAGGGDAGNAGNDQGGAGHSGASPGGASGAAGSGGGAAGGTGPECPIGCDAPEDGATCPGSQVYWTCFGTSADPTPPQQVVNEFEDNCTSKQTPRPTFCCPADFHPGC